MRTRRRTNNGKKNLLFKIIPFLLLRIRIRSRIRTLKSDPDSVKSRPDPQHCRQVSFLQKPNQTGEER